MGGIRRISQKHRLSIREFPSRRRSSIGAITKNINSNSSKTWSKVSNFFMTSLQDEVNDESDTGTGTGKHKIKNKEGNARRRGTKKRSSVKERFHSAMTKKDDTNGENVPVGNSKRNRRRSSLYIRQSLQRSSLLKKIKDISI